MSSTLAMFYLLVFPLAYGFADMFWMMLGAKIPFFKSLVYRGIVSVAITILLACIMEPNQNFEFFGLVKAIGTGFLAVIAFLFFCNSLQQEESGINTVITKGLSSVVAVSVVTLAAQEIHFKIVLALAALIIGLLLLYMEKGKRKTKISIDAIVAGIIWGVVVVLYKQHVADVGSYWFAFILELTLLISVTAIYVFRKEEHSYHFSKHQYMIITGIGVATAMGSIFNTVAYNYFSPSTITIVAKFAILPPFLFAYLFLKQKLNLQKIIGLAAILIAIYLSL